MSLKVEPPKQTRFMHLRVRNENLEVMPTGGLCIAYDIIKEGDREDLFCAFARCSKRDVYNKARARQIAEGRLDKWLSTRNPKLTIIRLNGRKPREAIRAVLAGVGQQPKAVEQITYVDKLLAEHKEEHATA